MPFDYVAEVTKRLGQLNNFSGPPYSDCNTRVTVSFIGPNLGSSVLADLAPIVVDQADFSNDTDAAGDQSWSVNKTFSATSSCTISKGLSSGTTASFQIPIPDVGSFSFGTSLTTTSQESNTTSTTETQTFARSFTINILPHTHVRTTATVKPTNSTTPFTGSTQFRGYVTPHVIFAKGAYLGDLFTQYPHPAVTVVDSQTINVDVEGSIVSIAGTDISFVATTINDLTGATLSSAELE